MTLLSISISYHFYSFVILSLTHGIIPRITADEILQGCLSIEPSNKLFKLYDSSLSSSSSLIKVRITSLCGFAPTIQVSGDHSEQIIELTIENVNLSGLIPNLTKNVINLEALSLVNTDLTELSDFSFENLKKLKKLLITDNQLDEISSKAFHGLNQLQVLVLSNNNIKHLADDCFSRLVNLEELSLDKNELQELHRDIFAKNKRLKVLNLMESLRTDPRALNEMILFSENHKLETLNLSNNYITHMHSDIFANLTRLKLLDLSSNSLDEALNTKWFRNLQNLEVLNVAASATSMDQLQPSDIGNLSSLKILNFEMCRVKTLTSHSFVGLPNLEVLNLESNNLKKLPPEVRLFTNNSKLRNINLSHCKIPLFSFDWFLNLSELEHVDFSYNNITHLSYQDFFRFTQSHHEKKNITFDFTSNFISQFYFRSFENKFHSNKNASSKVIVKIDSLEKNITICDVDFMNRYIATQNEAQRDIQLFQYNRTLQVKRNETPKDQCHCEGDYSPCSCYYNDHHINLNCRNLRENDFFISWWPNLKSYRDFTISLDLSNGNLKSLPEGAWQFDSRIVQVNLSDNQLNHNALQLNWSERFPAIKSLDLRRNELHKIPVEFSTFLAEDGGRNLSLYLDRNRFDCECADSFWIARLNSNFTDLIADYEEIYCSFNGIANRSLAWAVSNWTDTCIISMNEISSSTTDGPSIMTIIFILIIVFTGAVLAIYLFSVQRSKRHRRYDFENGLQMEAVVLKYDAFISYSHKDEHFVVNDLIPNLENPSDGSPKYRLCLHDRDWLAGEWILDQINQSIATSHRTIIVLSENFIESFWGQQEFRLAYQQVVQSNQKKLIVIIKDELPDLAPLDEDLRHFIANNTYLKWSDPFFWSRLREALPDTRIDYSTE